MAASAGALSLCAGYALSRTRRALPLTGGGLEVAGLESGVDVDLDRWGVPHIRAASLGDALFAQGFVTAQNRMVQMEALRRAAGGRLAEVLGKKALRMDVFMRDLGLHRVAEKTIASLPPDTAFYLDRYAAGVNAYLEGGGSPLPLELKVMSMGKPRAWSPRCSLEVLLFLNWTLDATWLADLMRGRLIRRLGREAASVLLPTGGADNVPVVKGDEAAASPPVIDPPEECELDFFPGESGRPPWMIWKMNVKAMGSNNWAVDGGKSSGGRPILCGDPHLQHAIPTAFFLCHITAGNPPYDVIGATLPGVPGVVMGRNERIAWGSTSLAADVTDLYVETFENAESHRYLAGGRLADAEVIEEEIAVFPRRVVRHRVVSTGHGPVIARLGEKALALRWVGHDPDNDSIGCFVRLGLARDWEGFRAALAGYTGPALNLVYADVEGNIAYQAAGRIPLREGHDGSVPVPGHVMDHEWKGYVPRQEMPQAYNPPGGWIATANNRVVEGYPHFISGLWEPSCRQGRIAELLAAADRLGPEDMRAIQGDLRVSRGALLRREVLRAAEGWDETSPDVDRALACLAEWDCRAEAESAAQSLYFMTWRVLTERLLRHRLGYALYFEYTTSYPNVNQAVEDILTARAAEWLPPSADGFGELLRQCLEEALLRLEARFRSRDVSRWRWGRLHSLEIPHLLSPLRPLGRFLNLGPIPHCGDGETVRCAFSESDPTVQMRARSSFGGGARLPFLPRFTSDRTYAGPVFRMIVDLSGDDASSWCLDVGQCANPLSPFYRNFFPLWRDMEYAPMAFSRSRVTEVARSTLRLTPRRDDPAV